MRTCDCTYFVWKYPQKQANPSTIWLIFIEIQPISVSDLTKPRSRSLPLVHLARPAALHPLLTRARLGQLTNMISVNMKQFVLLSGCTWLAGYSKTIALLSRQDIFSSWYWLDINASFFQAMYLLEQVQTYALDDFLHLYSAAPRAHGSADQACNTTNP